MRFLVAALMLALVAVVGASAALLLQSCGLRLPFSDRTITFCDPDSRGRTRRDLNRSDVVSADLLARVRQLEHELALYTCRADAPPLPPPPPPPPPPKPKTPSGLDPKAFESKDISVMEGCWQLSSDYAVREINTGEIEHFRYWRICFDRNGNGTQLMRSTKGARCEGRLTGRLPGDGRLTMREPGNLRCDNGASIFRRDINCRIDARGNAQCDTYQPETNGRSSATLRRARR